MANSTSGEAVHKPPAPRNVPRPAAALIPAPVIATIRENCARGAMSMSESVTTSSLQLFVGRSISVSR